MKPCIRRCVTVATHSLIPGAHSEKSACNFLARKKRPRPRSPLSRLEPPKAATDAALPPMTIQSPARKKYQKVCYHPCITILNLVRTPTHMHLPHISRLSTCGEG